MEFNISTNILRDHNKNLNYVVTPNTTQIFNRIFESNNQSNKSFTLIGNYGTGKSTFLWALEKNLLKEKIYFSNTLNDRYKSFEFVKLVGDSTSLTFAFQKILKLNTGCTSKEILEALEIKRKAALKKQKGYVVVIDEFGKFLEHINKNKNYNDLYLLQLIAEWINDSDKSAYFIITLHQNFISYSTTLDVSEKLEWEKIKGRFIELQFNEPIEQLLFFASKQLENKILPEALVKKFVKLNQLIKKSGLVNFSSSNQTSLAESLYPLDWLSANILVTALQRYGQNERSLFTFLNENNEYSINKFEGVFYNVTSVFDYLVNSLTSDIHNYNNPHRPQWFSAFRAIERAELHFEQDFDLAVDILKTTCLANIFCKTGGAFDKAFISNYIEITRGQKKEIIEAVIVKLEKIGIIRFYKHSNKYNFLEGTDIDIEQELVSISKELSPNFSISEELEKLITFPIECAKQHSYLKGTTRFFQYRIINDLKDINEAEGVLDGYINLIFNSKVGVGELKKISGISNANLFVLYKNSKEIHDEIFIINKYKLLIEKFSEDINAINLLKDDLQYHINLLEKLVLKNLFTNQIENLWFDNGNKAIINSKKELNKILSEICDREYNKSPVFRNELANKENLSPQINMARKSLFNNALTYENDSLLGFNNDKYPPEKSIGISLLKETGIHSLNADGKYFFGAPTDVSFLPLWNNCVEFLKSANTSKRNLGELYEQLSKRPYKLKKGFVEFWIPLFLIFNKEDYALFHEVNGFVPYLTDDILSLIHKAPTNYSIKSYDVSGLNLNLLEGYKELVNVETVDLGSKSTFLTIFGNFLRFYRGLNDYTINTKKLSDKAINLKEAIRTAKDPEDALFNQFPSALGFNSLSIRKDETILKNYTIHIQDAIREIRIAYSDLLDRIENTIKQSFNNEELDFFDYKTQIINKLSSIDINLLGAEQTVYFKRLTSPLDDRISWIKSVADVALGKSIDKMIDEEEVLLMNNIKHFSLGILKATDIHQFNKISNDKLISFEMTDASGLTRKEQIVVSIQKNDTYLSVKTKLNQKLSSLDKENRKQILLELLTEELN